MKLKKETLNIILGLLPIPFIWAALSHFGALDKLKNDAMDWRFKARGEMVADQSLIPPLVAETEEGEESSEEAEPRIPKVVYVDFDQRALSSPEAGERPWDRAFFAKVARLLLDDRVGARTVGYDFIFSSKSMSKMVPEENMYDSDMKIAELIKEYPDRIVLGANYTGVPHNFGNSRISSSAPMLYWKGYKPELRKSHPESPTYPMIFYEGEKRYGRLGMLSADQLKSGGAIPRWAPLYFPYEGDAHAKIQLIGLQFANPIEQKKANAGETIKGAEIKVQEAQNLHTRLQADIQKKERSLETLKNSKPDDVLVVLDKIKQLEKTYKDKSDSVNLLLTSIKANPQAAPSLQKGLQANIAARDAAKAELDEFQKIVNPEMLTELEATKNKLTELQENKPEFIVEKIQRLEELQAKLQEKEAAVKQITASIAQNKDNPQVVKSLQPGLQVNIAAKGGIEKQIEKAKVNLDV